MHLCTSSYWLYSSDVSHMLLTRQSVHVDSLGRQANAHVPGNSKRRILLNSAGFSHHYTATRTIFTHSDKLPPTAFCDRRFKMSKGAGWKTRGDALILSYQEKLSALLSQKHQKTSLSWRSNEYCQLSAFGTCWGHHKKSNNAFLLWVAWLGFFTSVLHFTQWICRVRGGKEKGRRHGWSWGLEDSLGMLLNNL